MTVPSDSIRPLPLLVIFHAESSNRENDAFANQSALSFVERGYLVLKVTDRGYLDSETGHTGGTSHWGDPQYEIRDAQFIISQLVREGWADPNSLGATGFSFGGSRGLFTALLGSNVVAGRKQVATGNYTRNTMVKKFLIALVP